MIPGVSDAKAKAKGLLYEHPPRVISKEIEKYIRPICEDLSRDDLLTRCLGGHMQNPNKSFNANIIRF